MEPAPELAPVPAPPVGAAVDPAPEFAPVPAPPVGIPPAFRTVVFVEILIFIAVLAAAYAYAWRKGVFEWR